MPNYGDVTLKLPPDWARNRLAGGSQKLMVSAVGHENGKADAFLTEDPEKRHQFRWVAPEDRDAISMLRSAHYNYCTKTAWTKNEHLWEWEGEGFIVHNGQRLMARDEIFYIRDQEELDREHAERDKKAIRDEDDAAAVARAAKTGVIIEDERGRQLRPLSPKQSQGR